ncbi:DUF1827 family protein [Sporolactobacillus terrae]|uniref:DUF1827 domain-containing protein n=1 Tax=Sporolactobacillus terrae TaxID=269673 RepID=A0A5K7X2N2_9BACL|nr:DUF1827 family protein [Sporolactobacillus terrae]BBN99198.1 hypothetical protein St703_19030 [Sporolactobacillus terrae]
MRFKDITNENENLISFLKMQGLGNIMLKLYARDNTEVLFSKSSNENGISEHMSIENRMRGIKKSEITFVITNIMKHSPDDVSIVTSSNNIIHISYPKSQTHNGNY